MTAVDLRAERLERGRYLIIRATPARGEAFGDSTRIDDGTGRSGQRGG